MDKFVWPRSDDTDVVNKKYIFFGPIDLVGAGPFELKRHDYLNIVKKYKVTKIA